LIQKNPNVQHHVASNKSIHSHLVDSEVVGAAFDFRKVAGSTESSATSGKAPRETRGAFLVT
jgi:hypothetical protein